ncbi:MAG: hypothetical protein J7M29_12015 [Verrucomicrobia bacterium]|nr:hypothetical protein [Verrucomicrobiota bacterium]
MTRRGLKSKLSGALIGAAACAMGLALTAQAQNYAWELLPGSHTDSYLELVPHNLSSPSVNIFLDNNPEYTPPYGAWCGNLVVDLFAPWPGLYSIEWHSLWDSELWERDIIRCPENLPYAEYILRAWAAGDLAAEYGPGDIQAALWMLLNKPEDFDPSVNEVIEGYYEYINGLASLLGEDSYMQTGVDWESELSAANALIAEAVDTVNSGSGAALYASVTVMVGIPLLGPPVPDGPEGPDYSTSYPHSYEAYLSYWKKRKDDILQPLLIVLKDGATKGAGTPGYWKNHPEAWPVDGIDVGGIWYDKASAIEMMNRPVKGNKAVSLEFHLIAAKLNVLVGNPSSCILDTIIAADDWLKQHGDEPVTAGSTAWAEAEPLHQMLVDYNEGRLCAIHRDDLQTTDAAEEHGEKPKSKKPKK